MAAYLISLNEMNSTCVEILNAVGYNTEPLRLQLPICRTLDQSKKLTKPRTKERQDAISPATSQGGIFAATGGYCLNEDDFFIAARRKEIVVEIKILEERKKKRLESA
jgi:hypothetical protein